MMLLTVLWNKQADRQGQPRHSVQGKTDSQGECRTGHLDPRPRHHLLPDGLPRQGIAEEEKVMAFGQ